MKWPFLYLLFAASLGWNPQLRAANALPTSGPIPYLSPEEEAKTIQIPEGYSLQLVLSDPIIKEPVVTAFDGNGRMFVAEMRSYMQDIDGKDEYTPKGRVSLHWSSKGNDIYDKHTVFIDHLVLPRMILPMDDGLLVNETDSNDLWLYRDSDGDGVADKKELFFAGGPRGGNLEHQQGGLIWDLDNWIYMSVNAIRLRREGTNTVREWTASNGGQWGISQDNYGKLWFVNAGGELGPLHFQEPIVYGSFSAKDQFAPGFVEVWPLVGVGDFQGGLIRVRPQENTLNHFTATCGGEIFRGDKLPNDIRDDLLFCEPVGRLIRRTKIEVTDGVTRLRNAYEKSEFIRSTDLNFRPVNLTTGPDGTLYITDMYRGIIQEGNWVKEGSYLRKVVQQYQMDENFGRGRIWRLVHKDFQPGPQPHLQGETPAQLVSHLNHPNGWWRDTSQKLLVLRGDKSVVPALTEMARTSTNHLARVHALWTLEGLGALEPALIREKLKDEHPQVRIAAIRTSETLYKKGDQSLVGDVVSLSKDSDPNVVLQVLMTANLLKWTDSTKLIETTLATTPSAGVKEIGGQLLESNTPKSANEFTSDDKKLLKRGEEVYKELCFSCHGSDGKGMPLQGGKPGVTMAPALTGSRTVTGSHEGMVKVVLKGLTGPVDGKAYDAQMVSMESNDDMWVAAIASYVRNSFGNESGMIYPQEVARIRAELKEHNAAWTIEELKSTLPQRLTNRSQWKLAASHGADSVSKAVDADLRSRYTTGTQEKLGMWFQIELPEETMVTGLELDAGSSVHDFPRGYKVGLSNDGKTWGEPVATGHGTSSKTEIAFPPAKARFIRITQTGKSPHWFWSIHNLEVLKPGEKPKASVAKKPASSAFE